MQRLRTDRILFITVVAMALFGALMIYSASSVTAEAATGKSWYYVVRQLFWMALGIPLMLFLKRLHYRRLQTPAVAFTAMAVVMILLGIAHFADPAHHRWIRTPLGQLQPSELAKPALVVFLAYFIALRSRALNHRRYTLLPAILAVGFVVGPLSLADMGTAIVLAITAVAVFFVAGLEWRYLAIAAPVGIVLCLGLIWQQPYRLKRVVGSLDPKIVEKLDTRHWVRDRMAKSATTTETNYQADQAKIAVGSGGPMGLGLMESRQKLFYLPEAHTDMIYAVIGEEWGLIGAAGVLLGFAIILWRGIRTTVLIQDDFGRYLALGITLLIVVQAFFNIDVALGIPPAKGFPLPMISYGGSSLLVTLASLGILMNVSEHAG